MCQSHNHMCSSNSIISNVIQRRPLHLCNLTRSSHFDTVEAPVSLFFLISRVLTLTRFLATETILGRCNIFATFSVSIGSVVLFAYSEFVLRFLDSYPVSIQFIMSCCLFSLILDASCRLNSSQVLPNQSRFVARQNHHKQQQQTHT